MENNKGGSLNLLAAVTMIAGGMIGSAIFSLSGLTMYSAGPAAILSWVIAALIMLCYGPVSYTPLDVYKRQVVFLEICDISISSFLYSVFLIIIPYFQIINRQKNKLIFSLF